MKNTDMNIELQPPDFNEDGIKKYVQELIAPSINGDGETTNAHRKHRKE